jgi:hypothetical protein
MAKANGTVQGDTQDLANLVHDQQLRLDQLLELLLQPVLLVRASVVTRAVAVVKAVREPREQGGDQDFIANLEAGKPVN